MHSESLFELHLVEILVKIRLMAGWLIRWLSSLKVNEKSKYVARKIGELVLYELRLCKLLIVNPDKFRQTKKSCYIMLRNIIMHFLKYSIQKWYIFLEKCNVGKIVQHCHDHLVVIFPEASNLLNRSADLYV